MPSSGPSGYFFRNKPIRDNAATIAIEIIKTVFDCLVESFIFKFVPQITYEKIIHGNIVSRDETYICNWRSRL